MNIMIYIFAVIGIYYVSTKIGGERKKTTRRTEKERMEERFRLDKSS